jgi:membrane-bound ClpP family serine protease
MRIYNTGTEVFEFTHGGMLITLLPKYGTFERKKESYEAEIQGNKGRMGKVTRFKDIWVKTSDEGINTNYKELRKDYAEVCMKEASKLSRSDIKQENEVIKAEMDKVAAVEKKVKEKEAELAKQEQELNLKMAMLKKVEEEAISKAAAKHK